MGLFNVHTNSLWEYHYLRDDEQTHIMYIYVSAEPIGGYNEGEFSRVLPKYSFADTSINKPAKVLVSLWLPAPPLTAFQPFSFQWFNRTLNR